MDLQIPSFATVMGTFSFTCTAQGLGNTLTIDEFRWYHNQTKIIAASNPRFSINSASSSSILTVTTAEREDGGEYYCDVLVSGDIDPIRSSPHEIQIQGN